MAVTFLSKASNYVCVLKNGMTGNLNEGRHPTPTVKYKFEGGIVVVSSDEHVKLLKEHPSYGRDFFAKDDLQDTHQFEKTYRPTGGQVIEEVHHGAVTATHGTRAAHDPRDVMTAMAKDIAAEAVRAAMPQLEKMLFAKWDAEKAAKASGATAETAPTPAPAVSESLMDLQPIAPVDSYAKPKKAKAPKIEEAPAA